jgi:toxin-antitoxin system PIN domain toxin
VILVDVNLLAYASVVGYAEHARAREWLDHKLNGLERVGLPWVSLVGFARLVTNARVFHHPVEVATAWGQIGRWLDRPNVWTPVPTERHREILGRLLLSTQAHAGLVQDAHLAALAIEHGLTLCSTDGDFARFPSLRWENPLA